MTSKQYLKFEIGPVPDRVNLKLDIIIKELFLFTITFYQKIICPLLRQLFGANQICRYSPSCSEYTKHAIQKYGIIRGIKLGLERIITCQPWGKQKHGRYI